MRKAKLKQAQKRRRPTRDRLRAQPKTKSPSWAKRNQARVKLQEAYKARTEQA